MNDLMKSSPEHGSDSETKKQPQTPSEREAKRRAALFASNAKFRAANPNYHAEYARKRKEAIKAGTWASRRKVASQVLPDASPCSTEPVIAP